MNKTYLNCFFALLHLLHLFRFIMLFMVPLVGILSSSNVISTSDIDPVGNNHISIPETIIKVQNRVWNIIANLQVKCDSSRRE